MDTKSLAKSKRAHTIHHKKHHPNQKLKSATTSATNNAPAKEIKEKPRVSHGPAGLPSNWDRYEDEDDFNTESQSSQPSDLVVPKSKGADYAHLISEAKSQSSTRISSEIFPSLEDFISDFGHGKESFFGVRGESLLSSIQNESFLVDDKISANYQASFLSLDLHALSEQLAKIDLPKRLFMEADLFPPDLFSEIGPQNQNPSQVDNNTNINDSQAFDHHKVKPPTESQSEFKAITAETELDMLLDSFTNANLKENASTSTSKKKTVDFDIDSTLDDLLKETSSMPDHNSEVKSIPLVSKSELLDDFDSWLDTI